MRILVASLLVLAFAFLNAAPVSASECNGNPDALGVSRILEIDSSNGPLYGTLQYEDTLGLEPNEVVLTFDDGPHPHNTRRILAALEKECVKATFFPVGTMAQKHPDVLQDIAAKGHTIGAHSWSHPNIGRLAKASATMQIERGFRAVNAAVDIEIAPFFRFPGLNDSRAMKAYAAKRGLAIFSIDISSDDWRGIGASTIIRRTMARARRHTKGIIIFHDTKYATASALPQLLRALKRGGFKIVHVVPKTPYSALESASGEQATVAGIASKPDVN
mgnify:CR=1 FL=1